MYIDFSKVNTDSDLEDLADELGISIKEVYDELYRQQTEGTPCEKCDFVAFRYSMYPCNMCTRNESMKDYYKSKDKEN